MRIVLVILACIVALGCPATEEKVLLKGKPATKGPWVMRMAETEATVFWESREAVSREEVEVTREDGSQQRFVKAEVSSFDVTATPGNAIQIKPADDAANFSLFQARVEGLEAGTCYRYRISSEAQEGGRFCTARAAGETIKFMAIGDSAATWGFTEKVVAAGLSKNPDFTVHLGDLQYYTSFTETWASWFQDVAPMLRAGAFLPAVGNHEFELDDEFPQYYGRLFDSPGQSGTTRWYKFVSGGVRFLSVDTESSFAVGSEQRAWLEDELVGGAGQYRATVMYFHKPIYTLATHSPRLDVRAQLEPLIKAHGVKLVLQAHNHGYERFEVDGVTYIMSGGGGAPLYDMDANVTDHPAEVPLRKSSQREYEVVVFTIDDAIRGEAINDKGEVIDSFVTAL